LKLLGVTVRTIQRWDKEGKMRCVRTVGGKRRIPESKIKEDLGDSRGEENYRICESFVAYLKG